MDHPAQNLFNGTEGEGVGLHMIAIPHSIPVRSSRRIMSCHFHVPVFQEMDSDAGAIARLRPPRLRKSMIFTHPPSAFCAFLNQVAIS